MCYKIDNDRDYLFFDEGIVRKLDIVLKIAPTNSWDQYACLHPKEFRVSFDGDVLWFDCLLGDPETQRESDLGLEEAEAIEGKILLFSWYFGDSPAMIDDHPVLFA